MKYTLLTLFIIVSSYQANAQLYGNSAFSGIGSYSDGYTTYWRIHTGPSDSGDFTHLGLYIDPTNYCDQIGLALFSSHVTPIKPKDLIGTVGFPTVVDGIYNEFPFVTDVPLVANTDYFIAIKGEYLIRGGREVGTNWPYPTWYFASWWGSFQDPAPSSLSAISSPNNQAIYAIANSTGLLPITLSYFNAKVEENNVILHWETSSEVNNEGWNIQKTTNGFTYETIAWEDGCENSNAKNEYQFIDTKPSNGMNIYRLEQVDLDGKKSYSDHRSVYYQNKTVSFYPNPVSDVMQFTGDLNSGIKIFDLNGVLVLKKNNIVQTVDLSDLEAGYYQIELNDQLYPFIKVD